MTPPTIIPRSERELVAASLGDVVLISYHGLHALDSAWTLLESRDNDKYKFIAQSKASKGSGDPDLVVVHSCPLDKIQFDRNLGAILNHLYEETDFIGPRRRKEQYDDMVARLKSAKLWY